MDQQGFDLVEMPSADPNTADEWEYEYDHTKSEVFLVDLDLTTVNRSIKPASANRGKRSIDTVNLPRAKRQKTGKQAERTGDQDAGQLPTHELRNGSDEREEETQGLQILDLHTDNPIVSYQGRVYSCSWTNMIGTTMFFSDHRDTPLYDPEIVSDTFDMIGMSRIKLVGNVAAIKPSKKPSQPSRSDSQAAINVESGHSLGTIRRNNAKVNADIRRQANFLEQLMNIKKNRGEEDNVRVVMNNKIAKIETSGKLHLNTQRRRDEIDELNRKVIRGDAEAMRKLENIYLGRDNDDSDDDQIVEDAQESADRPTRVSKGRIQIVEADMDDDDIINDKSDSDYQAEDQADMPVAASPSLDEPSYSNVT